MSLPIDKTITPDAPRHSSIEPEPKSINDLPEELLIHVLSMASPEHRCRICRVSRKWYTLGYHIEPLLVRNFFSAGGNVVYSYGRLEISTPYYHHSIKIKVNPLFYHHFSLSAMEFKITGSRRELLLRRQEFLTSPPISVVSINYRPDNIGAMLRTAAPSMERPDGIRVGYLVGILDRMLPRPTIIDTLHYPYHAFHMWFGMCESAETDE